MLAIAIIVAPIFALIAMGFIAARTGYMGPGSGKVLAEFGFKVAMPALLVRAAMQVQATDASPVALWTAFFAAALIIWVLTAIFTPLLLRRPAADAPAIAFGSTFGNSIMLGIPLGLAAFGPEAATPMALLVSVDTPLMWLIATLHQEWTGRRSDVPLSRALGGVLADLFRNPIILALLVGTALRFAGVTLDPVTDKIVSLLGAAAVGSALFALGMTVAAIELRGQAPTLVLICTMKLLVYPAIAFIVVTYLVPLPPVWANVVLLFAALPVGANAFLFASRYERAVGSVSAAIAISTVIAAITVPLVLGLLQGVLVIPWADLSAGFDALLRLIGLGG
ncbi:MAG: AEC family transporter [Pseudomonadota bacterium]